jgi:hypothetical protein
VESNGKRKLPTPTNPATGNLVSIQEIKIEIESLPAEERRQLSAFLVTLRNRELAEYRSAITEKIDDANPENWVSLEEYDQRVAS